jgi:metal-responsive CopG/Arc/MetJ family transcriptional regulator
MANLTRKPVNLSLPEKLVTVADIYISKSRERDRSALIEKLLVRHLRSKGVKLPAEYLLKD